MSMLIGEFAKRAGYSADTVRFYEKLGFFGRSRQDNGYRVYTDEDLRTADLIATGKSMGFSLREIQGFLEEMSHGSLDHAAVQRSLRDKLQLIDARIASLKTTRKLVLEQIEYCRAMELSEKDQAAQ
ncbi:MerR family transcriptional regulator [Kribbella sp. CA-253562]|uniref:MerR family transcriptional regulator n=1 Tax=Kribbella sp. CA-253562 TaxID=3239942 RepID=UPI003D912641